MHAVAAAATVYRCVMRMTSAVRATRRTPLLQVVKSAVATIAAWLVAGWLVPGPAPVFAAIAALLVVQPSLNQSFAKAIERSVGVVAGVVIASVLGIAFGGTAWVVLVAIVVALLVAWALRMTAGTSNQVAISALLVLTLGTATPDYALDRILETLIGAAIGVVVNVIVVPPVAVTPARESVQRLAEELAATLERLADALVNPQDRVALEELLLHARLLRPMRDAADTAIETAVDSLALNPRGGRHRAHLTETTTALERIHPAVTQTIGMTRATYDRYEATLHREPTVHAIAEQLRRAAHDVRRTVDAVGTAAPGSAGRTEPERAEPALTSPLHVATPSADHWILIGSLLEDLRRIHEELSEPV